MKTIQTLLCLSLLATAGAVFAQDPSPNTGPFRPGWYVAPMLSITKVDSERQTGDGTGYAIALGNRGDFATLELVGIFTNLKNGLNGSDAKLSGGQLALVVGPFFENIWLSRLFGVVGFGVFQRENHPRFTQDDTTIFGDVGAGYMYPFQLFGFDLNARGEVRYRYDVQQPPRPTGVPGQFEDYVYNLGLQIPLSRTPKPEAVAAPEAVSVVPVADEDNDGVNDAADQCPGTAAGAVVNDTGCVPAVEAAAPAPQVGDTVVLSGVNFESNSDQLADVAMVVLASIAEDLLTRPEQKSEVGGHTDSSGDDALNQDLSQRRAESARAYLIERGVNADNLTAVGYGETQPLDTNASVEGRAKNRRVELKVLDGAQTPATESTTPGLENSELTP